MVLRAGSLSLVEMPLSRFEELLASSDRVSSWTPLKPKHSNPNPNPLANKLWYIDFLTPPTPLIIPHQTPCLPWISYATQKTNARFMQDARKAIWSIQYVLLYFFQVLKQNNFIAYCSFKESSRPDCIFEIHQLWQSGFSRVYSNCCCSCWFEAEIIKNWSVISYSMCIAIRYWIFKSLRLV